MGLAYDVAHRRQASPHPTRETMMPSRETLIREAELLGREAKLIRLRNTSYGEWIGSNADKVKAGEMLAIAAELRRVVG